MMFLLSLSKKVDILSTSRYVLFKEKKAFHIIDDLRTEFLKRTVAIKKYFNKKDH